MADACYLIILPGRPESWWAVPFLTCGKGSDSLVGVMVLSKQYTDGQLNYFRVSAIVVDEFPKALRKTFKFMWDNVGPGPLWDDSEAVRNLFLTKEGGKIKVPTNQSYEEWDCTALFAATIFAQSFALPDGKGHPKTLSDLYVKPRGVPAGSFHTSVISPGGDDAETFALAIDQLRRLRNSFCHSTSSQMNKTTFRQYVELAKDAFKALGVKTDSIDAAVVAHFSTEEVARLRRQIKLMAAVTGFVLFD